MLRKSLIKNIKKSLIKNKEKFPKSGKKNDKEER